jgi:hypothetical protein
MRRMPPEPRLFRRQGLSRLRSGQRIPRRILLRCTRVMKLIVIERHDCRHTCKGIYYPSMLEGFITFLKQEWEGLVRAPFSFVMLGALCLSIGFAGGMLYYGSEIGSLHEQISSRDGQIGRYRVALGIDAASKGALVELNNQELALKAKSTVASLRALSSELDTKLSAIQKEVEAKKIDQKQASGQMMTARNDVSQDFNNNLASDANNIENELRKRLDPKTIEHVVRVPAFNELDANGNAMSHLPFTELFRGSGFDTFYIKGLANEIEQMADLLPRDSR